LRCCGSPLGRQNDEALVVSATIYETRLLSARRQECGLLALRRWSWVMNAAARLFDDGKAVPLDG
jgi:hypothetical protein